MPMSEGRTTVARRLKDGTIVEVLPNATTRQFPPDDTDWARVDALTEEEITATAETDPDNLPLTEKRAKTRRRLWTTKFIRRALGLTQEEFSEKFRIPLGTVRDWDQLKTEPDMAARAYLTVIAMNPEAVIEALERAPQAL